MQTLKGCRGWCGAVRCGTSLGVVVPVLSSLEWPERRRLFPAPFPLPLVGESGLDCIHCGNGNQPGRNTRRDWGICHQPKGMLAFGFWVSYLGGQRHQGGSSVPLIWHDSCAVPPVPSVPPVPRSPPSPSISAATADYAVPVFSFLHATHRLPAAWPLVSLDLADGTQERRAHQART